MSGLYLRGISHSYGRHQVLDGVTVVVEPGELVCLLGPSGCGKTTLLRLAAGLEHLQTGQVEINGVMVADGTTGAQYPPERRGVGLMFQDYALFPHLTVRDNITFGIGKASATRRVGWTDDILETIGLAAYAGAYPHTLSGGQQQRVALLRALAPDPQVLLLDEPFSGLDVTRRAQIRTDTLSIVKKSGVATLMVTHDPEEAMFMADRILVMNIGRVVQDGRPTELYFQPADSFVAELFGPVNRFDSVVRGGLAATPVGSFSAGALGDGTPVDVLIRPEAFRLAGAGENPNAMPGDASMVMALPGMSGNADSPAAASLEVVTARPLGRSSFLVLKLTDGRTLEARVPGTFLPDAGSRVSVIVNPHQAHVFAATAAR